MPYKESWKIYNVFRMRFYVVLCPAYSALPHSKLDPPKPSTLVEHLPMMEDRKARRRLLGYESQNKRVEDEKIPRTKGKRYLVFDEFPISTTTQPRSPVYILLTPLETRSTWERENAAWSRSTTMTVTAKMLGREFNAVPCCCCYCCCGRESATPAEQTSSDRENKHRA